MCSKSELHRQGSLLAAACIWAFMAVPALAADPSPGPSAAGNGPSAQANGAQRALWSRDNERFVRSWLLLGPIPATAAQLDPNLTPTPGAPQSLSNGLTSNWKPCSAYHDTTDLLEVYDRPTSRGSRADPEAFYAYATINRDKDGEALLTLATDNAAQAWVNGKLVHEQSSDRAFEYDSDQVPVQLVKGENRLLLKITRVSGPSRLAARVLESGSVWPRLTEIAPFVMPGTADELRVTTHSRKELGDTVEVDVLAAGGRSVAQTHAGRGEVVRFNTGSWPDGAYDIRFTTQTAIGRRFASYLPWYKGNAIAAARRLLNDASAASRDATGMTMRMLADMVRNRLANKLDTAPDDAWRSIHSPLMEYEELLQVRTGGPGPMHPGGFVRLAWEDEIDGSAQFCRAYLPPDYAPSRTWPVIMFLHGYNPPNPPYIRFWSVDDRHSPIADNHDVIYIEPHGRGNSQYLGIGEKDVLRCLSEAKRHFSVDDNRVYLTGESMGGSGTWIVSSRHPDLFAAVAPTFGGWDFRVAPQGNYFITPQPDDTPVERLSHEVVSSYVGAEGVLNVPIFETHGDSDQTVSVEYSRHIVRMLQRWGYDIRYAEYPGRDHESLDNIDAIVDWMLTHTRNAEPRHVRMRSGDLAGAAAYWVRVGARQEPYQLIDVDAQVIKPGLIRLDTRNVAQITLSPPPALSGTDTSVRVVWNGVLRDVRLSEGHADLAVSGATSGTLRKQPGFEGGLSRLLLTPFAVVVGTSSRDPLMRQRCQAKADAFVELWKQWQHVPPRVFRDDQMTPAEQRRYSLLLIGGPDENRITHQLAGRLPLKVARDGITIDGRKYPATDAVAEMIYPSPLQADRYVVVVAPASAAGLYFWSPALWHTSAGFPTTYWDWTIVDGRRFRLTSTSYGPQRGAVACGVFDQHWRRDDRWVYLGDTKLRDNSPLRHAPPAGFTLPTQLLDEYVGAYQVAPGVVADVSRNEDHLVVTPRGQMPFQLDPEGKTEFAVHDTMESLYFVRNEQGQVTGAVLNREGQELSATRMH